MTAREANSISMLGLAHVGDAVYELLIRCMLCQQGHSAVGDLHRSTVTLVRAEAQAQAMALLVDILDEEELGIVGPYEGAKPRQVIIDREGWMNIQRSLGLIAGEETLLPVDGAARDYAVDGEF